MPKYVPNDKLKKALSEPIEFELKGKMFHLDVITQEMVRAMAKKNETTTVEEFMSIFIGEEEIAKLSPIDFREVKPLVNWLTDVIFESSMDKEKNEGESTQESHPLSQGSSDTPTS